MFIFSRITSFHSKSVNPWRLSFSLIVRGARGVREPPRNIELEQYLMVNFQVARKPARLLSKEHSISDVEERVKYFQSIGLSQESVGIVFRKFPRPIMLCEVDEMDKRVNFLLGYTQRFRDPNVLITHLIPQYPQLLFHPLEAMEKRVKLLGKCNLSDEEIAKVLRYNPMTILTKLEDTFDELVQYLKDCGLPDQIIHKFFTKQPRSITFRWEAIEKRVRFFMDELGYTRERIIEVFTNNPMVLTANVERMRERSRFIKGEMGLTNTSLLKSPLVLRYSLERIQWRYHYLSQIGYSITDDTYLLNILYVTDQLFAKYIAKRPLSEILEFKEEFYETIGAKRDNVQVAKDSATAPC